MTPSIAASPHHLERAVAIGCRRTALRLALCAAASCMACPAPAQEPSPGPHAAPHAVDAFGQRVVTMASQTYACDPARCMAIGARWRANSPKVATLTLTSTGEAPDFGEVQLVFEQQVAKLGLGRRKWHGPGTTTSPVSRDHLVPLIFVEGMAGPPRARVRVATATGEREDVVTEEVAADLIRFLADVRATIAELPRR